MPTLWLPLNINLENNTSRSVKPNATANGRNISDGETKCTLCEKRKRKWDITNKKGRIMSGFFISYIVYT